MTQTDEIYRELMDGLRTGLDYDKLRLKWEGSRGPFYNALQRVLADAGAEIGRVSTELRTTLERLAEAQQRLTALVDKQGTVESAVEAKRKERESLEQQTETARKQIRKLNTEITAKRTLLSKAADLQETGFDLKQLQKLQKVLADIGTKRGLKPKQAVAGFFSDLDDYDAKNGFEHEIQRLGTVAETRKLEAQKWLAEKESLERACNDRREVVNAMDSLLRQGVKPEHIPAWDKSVQAAGGVGELIRDLARYKSVREAATAWEREVKRLSLLRDERAGEVDALEKRRAETQGAVAALSKAGIDEIRATREEAVSGVRAIIVELANEGRAYSEQKAEAVRLEKELACARYLVASDETLKSAPISAAEVLLRTVTRHCIAKGVNLRVPVPDSIRREASFYSLYDGIRLLELLRWVATGLATAAEEDRSAGGGTGVRISPRQYRLTQYT